MLFKLLVMFINDHAQNTITTYLKNNCILLNSKRKGCSKFGNKGIIFNRCSFTVTDTSSFLFNKRRYCMKYIKTLSSLDGVLCVRSWFLNLMSVSLRRYSIVLCNYDTLL